MKKKLLLGGVILFYLMEFLIVVVLVVVFYNVVEIRKVKKFNKKNLPIELKLFLNMYNVDLKKTSYLEIMKKIVFIIAIDAGLVVLFTEKVDFILLKIIIAIPCVLILLIFSYKLLGYYYKKKGMIKNES